MSPSPPPDNLADRLTRLEESLAFGQHDQEQLSAEIAALGRKLAELAKRLDAMEQREIARTTDSEDPPETQ